MLSCNYIYFLKLCYLIYLLLLLNWISRLQNSLVNKCPFLWDARLVLILKCDWFCEKDKKIKMCCYHSLLLKQQGEGYPWKVIDIPVQVETDMLIDKQNESSLYFSCKKPCQCFICSPVSAQIFDVLDNSAGLLWSFQMPWTYVMFGCVSRIWNYWSDAKLAFSINDCKDRCINKGSIACNYFALKVSSIPWTTHSQVEH